MKPALAIIGVVLAAAGIAAAEVSPAATNSLALVLRDGSQVRGKTGLEVFAIAGAYGDLNVPLAQIRGVVIEQASAKGETWQQVRIEMVNGDKLTGRPKAPKLDVETAYGTLSVPLADVVKIEVSPAGPAERPCQGQITVPANASADAGDVIQGHRYTFEATGLVGINVGGPHGGPASKADPNGHTISQMDGSVTDPQPADGRFPCPGLATHSLVGKIGGAACVPLGTAGSFIAPASGKLVLLCNDLIPGDNSGSWQVKIGERSAGPVLRLNFDADEGGKVTDLSGKGNHGVVAGARYTPQGKNGGGYCLSGTQEHITIPNSDSLEIRDQVTLAVWVNLASLGPGGYGNEHGYIINKGDDLWWNPAFCLGYNKAGEPLFHVGNATDPQRGGGKTALGETKIVPGQWVHLAGVYDGATVKLYVNGHLDREEKYTGKIRSDRAPVHLGGGKLFGVDWGNHFTVHGSIDEVMIFDRALTAEEIRPLCGASPVGPRG